MLKTQDSQASVGSGFLVDDGSLLITNYHVVSQYALQPGRYRLVYASVDGKQGPLQLLAFDVVHDLALLKPVDGAPLAGRGAVALRPADDPLGRGARIFSLGNPLDVGFAVMEGNYNGLVRRSFYPRIFFGGTLNPGMSGGPAVDDAGRVLGVNVAKRLDGEQVVVQRRGADGVGEDEAEVRRPGPGQREGEQLDRRAVRRHDPVQRPALVVEVGRAHADAPDGLGVDGHAQRGRPRRRCGVLQRQRGQRQAQLMVQQGQLFGVAAQLLAGGRARAGLAAHHQHRARTLLQRLDALRHR